MKPLKDRNLPQSNAKPFKSIRQEKGVFSYYNFESRNQEPYTAEESIVAVPLNFAFTLIDWEEKEVKVEDKETGMVSTVKKPVKVLDTTHYTDREDDRVTNKVTTDTSSAKDLMRENPTAKENLSIFAYVPDKDEIVEFECQNSYSATAFVSSLEEEPIHKVGTAAFMLKPTGNGWSVDVSRAETGAQVDEEKVKKSADIVDEYLERIVK